jgi:ABC-2 type transport system ATP-binding protein
MTCQNAFAYRHRGPAWVIRFSALEEDFRKDERVVRHASSDLPIPQIVKVGRVGDGFYAISERLSGDVLEIAAEPASTTAAGRPAGGAALVTGGTPSGAEGRGTVLCGDRILRRVTFTTADPSQPTIRVVSLRKTFNVPVREAGLRAGVRSLVHRETREVRAVDDIGFQILPGEIVGFLGPNGAGKTTTLKMLSGLLYPTSGEAQVLGHVPSKRESAFLRRITMVMGNRNQLQWDLPALDSYELIRAIYRLEPAAFRTTRDEFIELLDLATLVNKPVRNLSLGERMKVEIVGALLHRPQVLFLDEPTIGLDVTMQKRIRSFIADYNQRYGATVLLTSHYMADVQALCRRVIVIHEGRILYDGELARLGTQFDATKTIGVTLKDGESDLSAYGEVIASEDGRVTLRVSRADAPEVASRLLRDLAVADLTIEDPPIEDVIERVFDAASDGAR